MLPLTFADPEDYDKILEDDKVSLKVSKLLPEKPLIMIVSHKDGSSDEIILNHTMNETQVKWIKAGSALNLIAKMQG
jgi:aconitate hydratase